MFRKIFLSFWLTILLVAGASWLTSLALRQAEHRAGGATEEFVGSRGHRFTIVVPQTPPSRSAIFMRRAAGQWLPLVAILILGGIACFVLARHFANPLVQLGAAANAVADGNLATRIESPLTRRRDEIGALARDFDRMTERIDALVAAERRTLGDASHELRSPLARLTVALSLARQHPESSEYLDRIEREAERLDKLIAELLTLARIDSGVEVARSRFDVANVVEEIVADGDFEARAHNRRVQLIANEPCVIEGSAELVRSAIENVVRNAIRHTAEGTAVEVELRNGRLSVRDHGSGVPASELDEIFKPFRRIDDRSDGAGLGLAIADRVVRMHGGTITASNVEGGMLVVIELSRA